MCSIQMHEDNNKKLKAVKWVEYVSYWIQHGTVLGVTAISSFNKIDCHDKS